MSPMLLLVCGAMCWCGEEAADKTPAATAKGEIVLTLRSLTGPLVMGSPILLEAVVHNRSKRVIACGELCPWSWEPILWETEFTTPAGGAIPRHSLRTQTTTTEVDVERLSGKGAEEFLIDEVLEEMPAQISLKPGESRKLQFDLLETMHGALIDAPGRFRIRITSKSVVEYSPAGTIQLASDWIGTATSNAVEITVVAAGKDRPIREPDARSAAPNPNTRRPFFRRLFRRSATGRCRRG